MTDTQARLYEVERALGFTYPPSFVAIIDALAAALTTPSARLAFPTARLLLSKAEVGEARRGLPSKLLPFMREEQRHWPDIFALDLKSPTPTPHVVVWSDHAAVAGWESAPDFLLWFQAHIAKPR